MTKNILERINNAIKDIKNIQILFQQTFGEECLADKEIEDVLEIVKVEHEELQQYCSIGTVGECREAMEKQQFKKTTKDICDRDCCPECGWIIGYDDTIQPYCHNCGQALDWSGNNEK